MAPKSDKRLEMGDHGDGCETVATTAPAPAPSPAPAVSLLEAARAHLKSITGKDVIEQAGPEKWVEWLAAGRALRAQPVKVDTCGRRVPMGWMAVADWIREHDGLALRLYATNTLAVMLSRRDREQCGRPRLQRTRTRKFPPQPAVGSEVGGGGVSSVGRPGNDIYLPTRAG